MQTRLSSTPIWLQLADDLINLVGHRVRLVTPEKKEHELVVKITVDTRKHRCAVMIVNGMQRYLTEEAVKMLKQRDKENPDAGFLLDFGS